MENPINQTETMARDISPSSGGRTESPEFEFLTAATSPLVSADELFVNGLLLPLSLLHLHQQADPIETKPDPSILKPDRAGSKRYWKDINSIIFKKGDRIKSKKKNPTTGGGADYQQLNTTSINIINIWPFSRSRSAGIGSTRPKHNPTRKSCSAPCSRSNSASRKLPGSPSRVGVHLGRSSPVWQARRPNKPGNNNNYEAASRGSSKRVPVVRVLNLNVPMCIGGGESLVAGEGTRGGNMFNFRSMFTLRK